MTVVLLLIGYYNPILSAISDFIKALIAFDMNGIIAGFAALVPFGIGVIVGMFAVAKVIEILFEKCPLYAYWAIIGLIVASPIAIIAMSGITAVTVVEIITGVIALAVGFVVALKLGE